MDGNAHRFIFIIKKYTALNKEEANFNYIISLPNYIIFEKMIKLNVHFKSENSLKIHSTTATKQNFIFYFEIFCCKEEFAVLYYIQLKIYTLMRVHRLHGAALRVCFAIAKHSRSNLLWLTCKRACR